jgi:hypothetical protein
MCVEPTKAQQKRDESNVLLLLLDTESKLRRELSVRAFDCGYERVRVCASVRVGERVHPCVRVSEVSNADVSVSQFGSACASLQPVQARVVRLPDNRNNPETATQTAQPSHSAVECPLQGESTDRG